MFRSQVLICGGTGCTSSGSDQLIHSFESELAKNDLQDEVKIVRTGCFGLCALGPIVIIYPEGSFYSRVEVTDVPEIVSEHLLKGRPVERLLYDETVTDNGVISLNDTNFYKKQHRVALRNCGVINPENIDEYIAMDGYKALGICLTEKTPQEVIDIIKASGLRGRGGAGFPTGVKWQLTAQNHADQKYVACNADEGDPGAFMDRSVLEGDPHTILEAMAIAAYATGANHGFIYVRAEYPIAVKRLQIAIDQAREYGLLGKDIFGTGYGRGGIGLMLRDCSLALGRGPARRAAPPPPVPRAERHLRKTHSAQQRRDLRQHHPDHLKWPRVVRLHGHREV